MKLQCDFFGSCVLNLVPRGWIMFRYNMIFQTSFVFKENTALGTRLRNPNEEGSLVANTKSTEIIMAKLWALFN